MCVCYVCMNMNWYGLYSSANLLMLFCMVLPSLVPSRLTSGLAGLPCVHHVAIRCWRVRYVFMRTEGPDIFQWRQLGSPNTTFQPQPLVFLQSHRISKFESTFIIFHPQTPHYLLRFWGEIFLLVLNHLSYALGWKIYDPHHQHPSTLRCRLDLQTLEVKTVWGTCFHLVFVDRCSVVFYLVLHYKLGLIYRDLFLKVLKGRWGS